MRTSRMSAALVRGAMLPVCSALAALAILATPVLATDVVEIEEHWQLTVGGPTEELSAPQVTMTMSPDGTLDDDYFIVTLNHWSHPEFAAGGVQAQRWRGDTCVVAAGAPSQATLHHDNETISWVQHLKVEGGSLHFELKDGSSDSWGAFGLNNNLKLTTSSPLTRLNSYLPAISIGDSGISYAGNRVSSLVLLKLRWKTADGQWNEMVAPIDIDSDLDP